MTSNVKNNNQCDETFEYEIKFDNKLSLSGGINNYLLVVIVRIRLGKKHRESIISGPTCLWDS